MDEGSKELTAFSTQKDHWEWCRLPFGLRNAPAAFQREIQLVLKKLPKNKVTVYIDDILISSDSFAEHVSLVKEVLQTLQENNLKINPGKCAWFKPEVKFLGHIVGQGGIRKDPEYMEAIEKYPRPENVVNLQSFLGLINFQRKFIPKCSEMAKPLSRLTGGQPKARLEWSDEMINAFESLKYHAVQDLQLTYPDYSDAAQDLELYVDASDVGAGACLSQLQGEMDRIIGYASMCFSETQRGYSVVDRELAGLRWGVKTFRNFLFGVHFILYTDHQPLVYLNNMKLVCSRLARTVEDLAEYDMEIRYLPGRLNICADTMSRITKQATDSGQYYNSETEPGLPNGFELDGEPSPGGGDSLFISILKTLSHLENTVLPRDHYELRKKLVSEVLDHPDKYNIKLNRDSRRELRLMLRPGQLPCPEVILAACRIYDLQIFVYYWNTEPVVYRYWKSPDEPRKKIFLQCLSGIHYNALTTNGIFKSPQVSLSNIVTCGYGRCANPEIVKGMEISLITETTLKYFKTRNCAKIDKVANDISGATGLPVISESIAYINIDHGSGIKKRTTRFMVVPDNIIQGCILLGTDYLRANKVDVDFSSNECRYVNLIITEMDEETVLIGKYL